MSDPADYLKATAVWLGDAYWLKILAHRFILKLLMIFAGNYIQGRNFYMGIINSQYLQAIQNQLLTAHPLC